MPHATDIRQLDTIDADVRPAAEAVMESTGGLLRLAPNWVPRSFLQPGLRLKLHPDQISSPTIEAPSSATTSRSRNRDPSCTT